MNFEKMKGAFYKIILICLLIFVLYSTYRSIFAIPGQYVETKPIVIILGVLVLIFSFINLKKVIKKIPANKSNYFAAIICILFFIGLAIFGNKVTSIPTYDLSAVQKQVNYMLNTSKDLTNYTYFSYYSNNVPLAIFVYYIYFLGKILHFGNLKMFAIIINSLFIAITAFFTYLSVKKIKDYKLALITLIFFVINPIFYLYASYFYTDTLCMPFAAIALYLFIISRNTKTNLKSIIYMLLAGIMIAFGFKIRVLIGILLLGLIIAIVLNKEMIKNKLKNILAIVLGFIIGLSIYYLMSLPFNTQIDKNIEFPPTHWIMMGLNELSNGKYTLEDFIYTYNNKSYEEKVNANINMIKRRLKELGVNGFISLNKEKIAINWSNGLYDYVSKLRNVENINSMYEYLSGNKMIFVTYYSQICKVALLFLFMISIWKELYNKDKYNQFIFIAIFGAFFFYIIWEVSTRYSLTFIPWILIVWGIGLEQIEKMLHIKEIKCQFLDKEKKFNLNKMNRYISVMVMVCSITLLVINYNAYTKKKYTNWDKRVMQYAQNGNQLPKISNMKIEQTFTTSKPFNSISIKFKKDSVNKTTNYNFILKDNNGKAIVKKQFSSNTIQNDKLKTFSFKKINPKKKIQYTIEIYSDDATEENSIGISTYYLEGYDAYESGILKINGEEVDGDLTFQVQNEIKRPYTSKKAYITLSIMIILLELFAFYPYLKKDIKNK